LCNHRTAHLYRRYSRATSIIPHPNETARTVNFAKFKLLKVKVKSLS
jgi:hypothetical protein